MSEIPPIEERLNLSKRNIVFIGPEGSGKTTHAKKLSKQAEHPYVSTSTLIRYRAENDFTAIGDECRRMFRDKDYLDPLVILKIISEEITKTEYENGFILDGGLRTVLETQLFGSMLESVDRQFPMTVIYLRIPVWQAVERRLSQPDHLRRDDDTEEGVLSRLSSYYHELGLRASLIKNPDQFEFHQIDARGAIDNNYAHVLDALR